MNIFNSLGSNYDFGFVLKALFANNKPSHKESLIKFIEKKYQGKAILVYKGREAIGLALKILNLPKDSFIAINGFTCYAVYKAIINEGYNAEILDLPNPSDLNFSAETLQKALKQNPKIKAVIIQNTLGYQCDIEEIAKVCRKNDLILIEDLAHSVGTVYLPANAKQKALQAGKNGKEAGTIGDFVVLSFSQDKIIDAISGGALIIRNKKYQNYPHPHPLPEGEGAQERARLLDRRGRVRGKQQLFDRLYPLFTFIIRKTYPIGLGKLIHFILNSFNLLSKPMNESFYENYSLPNWYCSLVMCAFDNLKTNLEHRKKIVDIYNSMLDKKITYPSTLRYCIFVQNRKSLIKYLKNKGVYVSDIWYDDVDKSLPNAQIVANTILNLPTHINVSENDARNIAQKIKEWLKTTLNPPLRHSGDQAIRLRLTETSRISFAKSNERFWTSQNDSFEISSRIKIKNIESKNQWEDFISFHHEANFLQSWYWGEFHKSLNNDIHRTGFYENNKLVGVMLSVVENAKRGRYLTVPGGPIIDWQNPNLVSAFVKKIKRIAKEKTCVFVRVRPQLESSDFSKNLFKQHGFINAPMHLHAELTSQLDITKDEQALLSQMRKTTRYEIKKAINQKIKIATSTDPSLIKKFYDLQIETAKRQKFVPFSYKFLYEQFKVFSQNGSVLLYSAKFKNKLLAYAFIIFYGKEAVYHYGASTEEGREYPGAYLIQWEAIKEAKRRGMSRYNFWGVAPLNEPKHRFSGLSLFKRGFGGHDVAYLHAQDLIINYPKYLINYAIESIRKKVRNV